MDMMLPTEPAPALYAVSGLVNDALAADATPDAELALTPARLLQYKPEGCVALPVHTTIELLDGPLIIDVPGAARHCNRLVRWRGQWLALLDLDTLLHGCSGADRAGVPRYALVVAYQHAPGWPVAHAAIGLATLPQTVGVANQAGCKLPADSALWPLLALSCFWHEGHAVPILNTARLFAAHHG
jgi:CheW-like domain